MKIEVGKYYRTESGRKAFVAARAPWEFEAAYPFSGWVLCEGRWLAAHWSDDGDGTWHLIAEWKEPVSETRVVALLLGKEPYVSLFPSLGKAEKYAADCAFKLIAWKTVTLTEGEMGP